MTSMAFAMMSVKLMNIRALTDVLMLSNGDGPGVAQGCT
jgi:hypothetical protein